jgi:rubrerythrin
MDYFEFSIQMEKDAEALYRKMAERAPVEGVKKVLLLLAQDEVAHRVAIERLRDRMDVDSVPGTALEIKTVFDEMKNDPAINEVSVDAVEDYRKAVEIEQRGLDFYQQKFSEAEDEESKKLFEVLMRQESYHLRTTQNLLDVVQRPEWWVENAEFNPQDSDSY